MFFDYRHHQILLVSSTKSLAVNSVEKELVLARMQIKGADAKVDSGWEAFRP